MKKENRNYSFIKGFYLGLVLILITIIFYAFDLEKIIIIGSSYSIIFVICLLFYPVFFLYRLNSSFFISESVFKVYFSTCFLILSTALFVMTLFSYCLYNFIDTNLIFNYAEYQYSRTSLNSSFETFLEIYQNEYFSIFGQLQSYVFSLIPCILYSALISLLMKNIK